MESHVVEGKTLKVQRQKEAANPKEDQDKIISTPKNALTHEEVGRRKNVVKNRMINSNSGIWSPSFSFRFSFLPTADKGPL